MAEAMTLDEQAAVGAEFLRGLVEAYGLDATIETRIRDAETVELAVDGEGLGVLVGPKGATLAALQDVTRSAVQHRFATRTDRILVDVARYRERRTDALRRFTEQVSREVVESGEERLLEPMSAADRKVVHDMVNELDGVSTRSEGEDPYRYVVIAPAP
ncbi:MAG: single-stranded DNA-binding protein [Actinomycetota bacterium]|nr:single-stranded DNA-binding protein [Actinomycetota bacterium]